MECPHCQATIDRTDYIHCPYCGKRLKPAPKEQKGLVEYGLWIIICIMLIGLFFFIDTFDGTSHFIRGRGETPYTWAPIASILTAVFAGSSFLLRSPERRERVWQWIYGIFTPRRMYIVIGLCTVALFVLIIIILTQSC